MDFHGFSEGSWSQVGTKNRLKIDAKKQPKIDGKKKPSWRRLGGILEVQEVSRGRESSGGSTEGRTAAGRISGPFRGTKEQRNGGREELEVPGLEILIFS